ncbi:MAG: hypothetical protein Q9157_008340, partial [Trypethelium eluteriae]
MPTQRVFNIYMPGSAAPPRPPRPARPARARAAAARDRAVASAASTTSPAASGPVGGQILQLVGPNGQTLDVSLPVGSWALILPGPRPAPAA